ncbi:MAG: class II fructose-bisphosphate aldolase family protein [Candidatus Nealsonbacteria bacterium]|nr:class II fructose-bisphosphate aldolase family protein [Candidatus Nealsonbacteria bacterium]
MKIKNLKHYFKKAEKEKWAIGQFNFSTLEQLKGILKAAQKLKSPLILGTSEKESRFFGLEEAVNLVKIYQKKLKLPVFLNLDHGKSLSYTKEAIKAGYDSVHFDGSELPIRENIKISREIREYARKKNVFFEGELEKIARVGEKGILTDPCLALKFVKETGIDGLAISIGNVHGIEFSGLNPDLNLEKLKEIREKLKNKVFLVLHGGSGTKKEDLKKAINLGIVKININTELRMAYKQTLKKSILENRKELRPYQYLLPVIQAIEKAAKEKILLFGSSRRK